MLLVSASGLSCTTTSALDNPSDAGDDSASDDVSVQADAADAPTAVDDDASEAVLDASAEVMTQIEASGDDAARETDGREADVTQPVDRDATSEATVGESARDAERDGSQPCPPGTVHAYGYSVDGGTDLFMCGRRWEGCTPDTGKVFNGPPPDDAGQCALGYVSTGSSCITPCGALDWPKCSDDPPEDASEAAAIAKCPGEVWYANGIVCCWHGPCYGSPPARLDLLA